MTNEVPRGGRRGAPAEGTGRTIWLITRLAAGLFACSFAFGGLPQSEAVRDRLARAGLVSSGRADLDPSPATTTAPLSPVVPANVIEMLAASGYPDVDASELDRVVTLTGTIPDEASRRVIERLVRSIEGVEGVVDATTIATPGSSGDATIVGTTSHVVLGGSVPDVAAAEAVLAAVQSVYVADQIEGAVTVDPEIAAPARIAITLESTRPELGDRVRAAFDAIDPDVVSVDLRFRQLEVPRIEQDLDDLLTAEPIEFPVGSSQVDEASQATLDAVAALLEQFPDAVVEVGGHTDDTGADQANRRLSASRAEAVVAALQERGVRNELLAVGYGETRPRATPFDNDEARAANRRIEFVIVTS